VEITNETSLEETLDTLAKYNILAAAVRNTNTGKLEGVLSMYEIMSYIAWASWNSVDPQLLTADNFDVKTSANVHLEQPASAILGTSGILGNDEVKGLWVIRGDQPIKHAFELLGKGVYRILVEIPWTTSLRIFTQSDIVRFIHMNIDKFEEGRRKTVAEARLGSSKVFSVHEEDNALYAFRQLRIKEVQGFAIVNKSGTLIGNFSSSDMRGLKKDDLQLLSLTVGGFLKAITKSANLRPPITVASSDSIEIVINQLLGNQVHRVYLVDSDGKPTSVITLSDVILHFFTFTLGIGNDIEPSQS